jgi:hypothetical protein
VATFRRTSAAKHHDPHRNAVGLGQTVDCGGGPNGDCPGGGTVAGEGGMRTAIAALLLLLPVAADAATIKVVPLKDKFFKSVITVTGKFNQGDEQLFSIDLASAEQPAIVAFNSPGGELSVGIGIGEQVKAKKLATFVPEMMTCSSACALAWIAGAPRYMQGRVGFHAAADGYGPKRGISSFGNALAGAYLSKLGMSYSAVVYLTKAAPSSMEWLTKPQATKFGIVYAALDPTIWKADVPAIKEAAAPAPTPVKWPDVPVHPDLLSCDGLVVVGQPCKKPLSCAFGQTCTVPGGEIRAVTKDLGTVRVPRTEPPALTTEAVTNAISKHEKLKVIGPVYKIDSDVMLDVKP